MEDQEGNTPQVHQPVKAVQVEVPIRQARDRAQYVRQQKGHSWVVWWLLLGPVTLWIPAVYYSFSPNHYWHV
ncbi:membrane protein [Microbacterium phage CaptainRex]|nr:membrane protein [Microbacterium phage Hasitha]UVK59218.1 membrane protein [Microbacterium phage Librie]WIC89891.1 membrane protein [Microbacterium phage CaptainRex]